MSVFTKGSTANKVVSTIFALTLCFMSIQPSVLQQAWGVEKDDPAKVLAEGGEDAGDSGETPNGDQAGSGNSDEADTSPVVNNVVTAVFTPEKDKDNNDEPIVDALTGEALKANVYAYNDNPNAIAVAKVRLYAEQTTIKTDAKRVAPVLKEKDGSLIDLLDPENKDKNKVELKVSTGKPEATTVTAEWKKLDAKDKDNPTKGKEDEQDLAYLEFELPAGASVSKDMLFYVPTGYDQEVKTDLFCMYQTAGSDEWVEAASDSKDQKVTLTWTGSWEWKNFTKKVNGNASVCLPYENGSFFDKDNEQAAKELTYTFGATNSNSGNTGVIYSEKITLTDTLTLPKNFSLDGVTLSEDGKSVVKGDKTLYKFNMDNVSDFAELKIDLAEIAQNKINFTVVFANPNLTDVSWNPVGKMSVQLYLDDVDLVDPDFDTTAESTEGETQGAKAEITNEAALEVASVGVDGIGDDATPLTFSGEAAATVTLESSGKVGMEKSIYWVCDEEGYSCKNSDGSPKTTNIKGGYKVTYCLKLTSSLSSARVVTVVDTMDAGLEYYGNLVAYYTPDQAYGSQASLSTLKRTEQKQDDGTTVNTFKIQTLPKQAIYVFYTVKVDYSQITAGKEITELVNTAKMGDIESSTKIYPPESGELTFTKEVVSRRSWAPDSKNVDLCIYVPSRSSSDGILYTSTNYDAARKYLASLMEQAGMDLSYVPYASTVYYPGDNGYDALKTLLTQMNAGDVIEYKLTLDNQSSVKYENQEIVDYQPLGLVKDSSIPQDHYTGWKYLVVRNASEAASFGFNASNSFVSNVAVNLYNLFSVSNGPINVLRGFTDAASKHDGSFYGWWNNKITNMQPRNASWTIDVDPFTKYEQTTYLVVPGDNTIASTNTTSTGARSGSTNKEFQRLLTAYMRQWEYGRALPTAFATLNPGSTDEAKPAKTTDDIDHSVAGQAYVGTGSLATSILPAAYASNNGKIEDGYVGRYFSGYSSSEDSQDLHFFNLDDNQTVVNYVYVYNDSPADMDMKNYNLKITLPSGFEWKGFTRSLGSTSGSQPSGNYHYYSAPKDQISEKEFYWMSDSSGQRSTFIDCALKVGDFTSWAKSTYSSLQNDGYFPYSGYSFSNHVGIVSYEQGERPDATHGNGRKDGDGGITFTANVYGSALDYKRDVTVSMSGSDTVLPAYTGMVLMYMCKAASADGTSDYNRGMASYSAGDKATFGAVLESNASIGEFYSRQIATQVAADEYHTSSGDRSRGAYYHTYGNSYIDAKYGNHGIANGYLDCDKSASDHPMVNQASDQHYYTQTDPSNRSPYYGNAGSYNYTWYGVNKLYSFVNYTPRIEKLKIDVTKEVFKNSGADAFETEKTSGSVTNPSTDGHLSWTHNGTGAPKNTSHTLMDPVLDDYNKSYCLHDGLHQTVDGTVTWKTTITNEGDNSNSATTGISYGDLNFSTLVETIDAPYELREVVISDDTYSVMSTQGTVDTSQDANTWSYGTTSNGWQMDIPALSSSSWSNVWSSEDNCYVKVLDRSGKGYNYRITYKKIVDGAVGYGWDVSNGDRNTYANQYIIELSGSTSAANYLEPVLVTKDKLKLNKGFINSVDAYFTFSTTDAIETNYNSFGVYVGNVKNSQLELVGDTDARDVSEAHTRNNVHHASVVEVDEPTIPETIMNGLSNLATGFMSGISTLSALYPEANTKTTNEYPLGGKYGTLKGHEGKILSHSDWTDTSYTDGVKYVSLLDKDGKVAVDDEGKEVSINTRDDGNMVLSERAKAGDTVHVKLTHESLLSESENYDYYNNLVMYDMWATESESPAGTYRNAYKMTPENWESLKVVYRPNAAKGGEEKSPFAEDKVLTLGKDYEIYYTMSDLVTFEHHPIKPVNTLEYAADLDKMDSDGVEWIKYDPANGADGQDVAAEEETDKFGKEVSGVKIVLLGDYAKVENEKLKLQEESDDPLADVTAPIVEYAVEFDATVRDGLTPDVAYPNILAWSAQQHNLAPNEGNKNDEWKPFKEDTTAIKLKVSGERTLSIGKSVVEGSGQDEADVSGAYEGQSVQFAIISNKGYNFGSDSISAIAKLTVPVGETIEDVKSSDALEIVYPADGSVTKQDFFEQTYKDATGGPWPNYYYFYEMDADGKPVSDMKISGVSVSGSGAITNRYNGYTINLTPFMNVHGSVITDEQIRTLLATPLKPNSYLLYRADSTYGSINRSVIVKNQLIGFPLTLFKVDTEGEAIVNEVEFKLTDTSTNKPVSLVKTDSGYAFTQDPEAKTVETIKFSETVTISNLPVGSYKLEEVTAPSGYLANYSQEFFVTAEGKFVDSEGEEITTDATLVIENEPDENAKIGTIDLTKVDDKGTVLKEAAFQVFASTDEGAAPLGFLKNEDGAFAYAEDKTGVELLTTVETVDGVLSLVDMPYGTYYLKETSAPEGYAVAKEALEVTVTRNDSFVSVEAVNEYVSGTIEIAKKDADSKEAVIGSSATFNVMDGKTAMAFTGQAGSYTYAPEAEGAVTDLLTSEIDGTLTVSGMPKGEYTIKEVAAPAGYAVADSAKVTVDSNDAVEVEVLDKKAPISLDVHKQWKLDGAKKTYDFNDITFDLYKSTDGAVAELVEGATAKTDDKGRLSFKDLTWGNGETYVVVEDMPEGYVAADGADAVWKTADGKLLINPAEEGIPSDAEQVLSAWVFTPSTSTIEAGKTEGSWAVNADLLNVKLTTYGGMYASVSYKTIDNHKIAEQYPDLLNKEKGFGFFHTKKDYSEGNYNYVHAVNNGDMVTYTLNVFNVSDYEFGKVVLVDRMPEVGDTGVVNLSEVRDSEFSVVDPKSFQVTMNGKLVPEDQYTVQYSTQVEFTEADFNNESTWSELSAGSKSFRVAFADDFVIEPGANIVVTYDGVIDDAAKAGQIAWNDFAYRYTALTDEKPAAEPRAVADEGAEGDEGAKKKTVTSGVTQTPEPPKVGVKILTWETEITGSKTLNANNKVDADDKFSPDFEFALTLKDATALVEGADNPTIANVTYLDGDEWKPFPEEGVAVTAKNVKPNGEAVDFAFPKIRFDRYAEYTFEVTEVQPDEAADGAAEGVTYDETKYVVTANCANNEGPVSASDDNQDAIRVVPTYSNGASEGAAAELAAFVNTYGDVTSVAGEKTWNDNDDQDGLRPSSITVNLLADGKKVASKKVTAADDWKYSFDELAKYKNGKEVTYTISEDAVEGYKAETDGYNLINSHDNETVKIKGKKTWKDDDDKFDVRPESITINVLADGKKVASKEVTEADNWKWSFAGLPKYKDGKKVKYTISEDSVEFYTSEVKGKNVVNSFDYESYKKKHEGDDDKDKNKDKSPKTGDSTNVAIPFVLAIIAAGVFFVARRQRKLIF